MKKIVVLAFLLGVWSAYSQEKIPFNDPTQILTLASEAANKGDFQETINQLSRINPNDSLYVRALRDKTYYLMQLKKYQEAIDVADFGLSLKNNEQTKSSFYINKAVALIGLKKYNEALKTIELGLKVYPKHHLLWFNKAVTLEGLGKLKEAVNCYETSITYNPYYAASHLRLGNLCYQKGLYAQALMCFNMYMLINPDGSNSFNVLKSLNNVVKAKAPDRKDNSFNFSDDDSNFESVDLILNSLIALNDDYKVDHDINIALTKQNHALLSQLKEISLGNDFWSKRYIPFFIWIQDNGHFEDFIYTICYSIENEDYKKIISKKIKNITSFIGAYREQWTSLVSQNTVIEDNKPVLVTYTYDDDGIQSYGPVKNNKELGSWKYYYSDGQLKAIGSFDDSGEKHGKWEWFYKNGQLKETATYVHGKAQGKNLLYHKNGRLYIDANVVDQKIEGEYKYYKENGALSEKKNFSKGVHNGPYQSYFMVGKVLPEFDLTYKNDSVAGKMLEYYANGEVFQESFYKNGLLELEKKYFIGGELSSEVHYSNNELNGSYKIFHSNKKIAQQGQALDGAFHGSWKTYYRNGTLQSEFSYSKGKIDGLYKYYDTDGLLFYEFIYRKGEIIAYKYFDKKGNVIKEARKKGGEFMYEGLNSDGSIASKGLYDISGGKKGIWEFYSQYGVLTEKGNYVENKPEGVHTYYFNDGSVQSQQEYKNGVRSGYFVEYYKNGKISQQGWTKDDVQVGEWRDYHIDGSLKNVYYFHKGQYHGKLKGYSVEGKLVLENSYEYGTLISEKNFDSNGKLSYFFDYNSPETEEVIESKFSNGNTETKISYLNKIKHGPYTVLSFDGKKMGEGAYVNDMLNGPVVAYYDNGQINYKLNDLNGNYHGEQLHYYEDGTLKQKENYDYGEEVGEDISYFENGQISNLRPYVAGEVHGKYKFFDISGKLQMIRFYNYGKLIGFSYHDKDGNELEMIPIKNGTGKIVSYYDNGKVSREMEFFNGLLVNNYKSYYYNGQLESNITFSEGEYHQKYLEYYPNGSIKTDQNYIHGTLQGPSKKYYENGQVKVVENYLNNVLSGPAKYFSKEGKVLKDVVYFDNNVTSQKE